jgi:RecB family exonuclease
VGLAPRGVAIDEQHRRLRVALAAGGHERLVSFPAADLRSGRTFEPSRWIDLTGSERVDSFAAGLRSSAEPSGPADLDLRLLVAATDRGEALGQTTVVRARTELAAGLHVRGERARDAFTRFDGNVGDGIAAAHLDERLLSPTSLERYAGCPFRYLLTNVLRVGAVERPEELDDMSPMDKGSLVHEVLEHFVGEVLERPARDQPGPDEAWTPTDHARVDELFDMVAARYETEGRTGRWLRWQHTREGLRRALHAFLVRDDQYRRAERARPAAAEMTFGNAGEAPVDVRVGDRILRFHGQADRIDRTDDGGVVVIDYKVARPTYWGALVDGDPVQRGQRLQLPIYALAARQRFGVEAAARAGYVFIHDAAPVGLVGYEVDEARLARFRDVVGVLAEGITAGVFPLHPGEYQSYWGTHANCTFCDYDRLCPPDRGDEWESVEDAPELAAYVDLVEGENPWEDAEEEDGGADG